jgi:hypothetical protein
MTTTGSAHLPLKCCASKHARRGRQIEHGGLRVRYVTPWNHVPATYPLNAGPKGVYLGWSGLGPSFGELELTPLQKAWIEASDEMMKDKLTKADAADENFLNHVVWYSATDWKRPYPGETEILWPDDFVRAPARKAFDGDDDDDQDQDEKLIKAVAAAERVRDVREKH